MTKAQPITLFISDLHLSPLRPDLTDLFLRFLSGPAQSAQTLYILGDLFEGWVGDDLHNAFTATLYEALQAYTQTGRLGYFMAGNRDFLVNQGFAQNTGFNVLSEPTTIDLYGTPTLLMHGDSLCTLDVHYLRFRKIVRHPVTKQLFLSLPLPWREKIFNGFRKKSKSQVAKKSFTIMDVTEEAVIAELKKNKVSQLIHGHVHRPAHHLHQCDTQPCHRWVLGDWGQNTQYLTATKSELKLTKFQ